MLSQEQLFAANTRLAYKIANEMARKFRHVEPEEFSQVSLQGLWEAAKRYDPTTGNKFSTFAYATCVGKCKNYVRACSDLVKEPAHSYWKRPRILRLEAPSALESGEGDPNDLMLDRLLSSETVTPIELLLDREEKELGRATLHKLDDLPWEWAFSVERYFLYGDSLRVIGQKLRQPVESINDWIDSALRVLGGATPQVPKPPKRPKVEIPPRSEAKTNPTAPNVKRHLDDAAVRKLLRLKGKMTATAAAQLFGVSQATVSNIWAGRTRKRASKTRRESREMHGKAKLTYEQVVELLSLKGQMSQREAGEIFGITQSVVGKIWAGKSHRHINIGRNA